MKWFICNFVSAMMILIPFSGQLEAANLVNISKERQKISRPSEFIYQSFPHQELISIRLLGEVTRAGLYHIPKGLDLITLLSLAGGTTKNANLENIIISNDHPTKKIKNGIELNLTESLSQPIGPIHPLRRNDIILIKPKVPIISNDTWKIISVLSVILTTTLTAVVINEKL